MQKSYEQILGEFKDAVADQPFLEDLGWTGDVKYHAGARARVREESAPEVVISMPPNPSHLEFVNPVVVGMARAACTDTSASGLPVIDKGATLPVLIHGDAAFPGQGIVAETLNLSRLRLYDVAAPSTSSRTTRLASPPRRASPTPRRTRAAWRAASILDFYVTRATRRTVKGYSYAKHGRAGPRGSDR